MNENVSMTKEEIYSKDYIPYSIKYGRMTSLIGVVASFVPLIVLALVFGVMPTAKAIAAAAAIRISACLVYYFIEPISFQPVLGIPGTYMAFLSGNISNLRVPCSSVASRQPAFRKVLRKALLSPRSALRSPLLSTPRF